MESALLAVLCQGLPSGFELEIYLRVRAHGHGWALALVFRSDVAQVGRVYVFCAVAMRAMYSYTTVGIWAGEFFYHGPGPVGSA